MGRIHSISLGLLAVLAVAVAPAHGSIFIDALGFEDDVDLVVSPNREFVVVPEELENGADARIRIIDLDPVTGAPLAILFDLAVVGFENGVDPFILRGRDIGFAYLVLVPLELQDGTDAHVLQLATDVAGNVIWSKDVDLGNLGFREDVDGLWDSYTGSIALFPLESENRDVRGILAIDVSDSDGDWGSCLLLSTDGRLVCEANEFIDWLPGLAEAVDPDSYPLLDRLRMVLPVSSAAGSDLLLVDFDSDELAGNAPPVFMAVSSAKTINAAGARPLTFPGYERDVDIVVLEPLVCEDDRSILIPVEGPGDVADLYKLDEEGVALWVYSIDDVSAVDILGYEEGVDLAVICNLVILPGDRIIVPIENEDGTDADLLLVNLLDGHLIAKLENPAVNPGLTIPGYEIGVDVVKWTQGAWVAAVEPIAGNPGLVVFNPGGVALASLFDPGLLGFWRSVDPIVAATTPFPSLIVPIAKSDGSDADVLVFSSPPGLAVVYSLEIANPGLTLDPFQWDLDLGLIDKAAPGELWVCLPEENEDLDDARLRYELTAGLPGDRVMALATWRGGLATGSLYLVDVPTGNILVEQNNVLGLETGLDMVAGSGPITPGLFPAFPRPTGVDHDGDPTLFWDVLSDVSHRPTRAPGYWIPVSHTNPFAVPGRIDYVLVERGRVAVEVFDIAGRRVSAIFDGVQEAGEQGIVWNAADDRGRALPSGVYLIRVKTATAQGVSKLVLIR